MGRMAMRRDGLWDIISNTVPVTEQTDTGKYAKYMARNDRALPTIVLSLDPSLLYLISDSDDPAIVWNKLSDQFQKKS
jgi:hypothetical protein